MRTPAIDPGEVIVASVGKPLTMFTGQQIAPLSFEELPGGDVPGGNEPRKAEGRMDGEPAVKGVAFSMYSAVLNNFVQVEHSYLIIDTHVVNNYVANADTVWR